jgi:hypothetical protein
MLLQALEFLTEHATESFMKEWRRLQSAWYKKLRITARKLIRFVLI